VGRKLWVGGDRHLLTMGGGGCHAAEEDVGVMARCTGGVVDRQRLDPGGIGRAMCAHLVGTEQDRPGRRQVDPRPQ
jgi:hypothetical protein